MQLKRGTTFIEAEPSGVVDFLKRRQVKTFTLQPDRLHIANDGSGLFLQFTNGKVHQYPLRESFYLKLLKWFSFPPAHMRRLNIDTVTSVLNDFLLSIASPSVTVKIEDGEALTITSNKYSEMPDLDLISLCASVGIRNISRNDFFIRLYSSEKFTAEPVPGDACGFGFNILNSETGFRALSVQHYIIRYICSNGAVAHIGSMNQRIHFGFTPDEMWEFASENLLQGEESRTGLIEQLKSSTNDPAASHITAAKSRLRAIIGWRETAALLETLPPQGTRYDLINLITAKAKEYDPGRRLQLESLGGMLITTTQGTTTIKEDIP